jgi:hypothetical protein
MSESQPIPQLEMVWPERLLQSPPIVWLPAGYALRTYRPGDEARFYRVMELSGWPGWDDEKLRPWFARIVPEGWLMAVREETGEIAFETLEYTIPFRVDPLEVVGVPFRIRGCYFPRPGVYLVQFWYEGELVEERPIRMR